MNKKKKKRKDHDLCLKIQWSKICTDDAGNPICPDCKKPAEMVLGLFGNPCFAHKPEKKKARR